MFIYFKLFIDDSLTEVSGGAGTFSIPTGCLNIGMKVDGHDVFSGKISCIQVD